MDDNVFNIVIIIIIFVYKVRFIREKGKATAREE
jgi:hypothetical protein